MANRIVPASEIVPQLGSEPLAPPSSKTLLPPTSKTSPPPALKVLPPLASKTLPPLASKALPSSASPSSPFLDFLKSYVQSKLCYHSSALTNATITNIDKNRVAYQIDLWTLIESRELKRLEKPYNNENAPNEQLRNAWDYEFQRPATVLKKKQKTVHDLTQTRSITICSECNGRGRCLCPSCDGNCGKRCTHCHFRSLTSSNDMHYRSHCSYCNDTGVILCSTCNNTGRVDCDRCKTRGNILHWYQLTIQRHTIHSISYQSNTPLPPKIINKTLGKETYASFDDKWSHAHSFTNYFQNAFANQANFPVKLPEITEDFNRKHLTKVKKNSQTVQLKLVIQKLNITEVEYELQEFINKRDANMGNKFRFYHYGVGKKSKPLIYENDYPLNTCGCCGVGCAHYSKCCTIS